MSFNNIFSTTTTGAIVFTGNTLGLSKAPNSQNAGTSDSIGAFISTNSKINIPTYPYPPGTTLAYFSNSSSAVLNIPDESTILYAQLIWGGTYKVSGEDYTNYLKNPIDLTIPNSSSDIIKIYPEIQDSSFNYNDTYLYSNSANITNYVTEALSGTYTVGNVVGTTSPTNNNNCCGWTLAVVYKNSTLPYRNLNLFVGGEFIDSTSSSSISISGFTTPSTGPTHGRILVSALEGDANISGDQVLFGPDADNLNALSGTNNPVNNFFGSQINNSKGLMDILGTFGSQNQIVATTGSDVGTNIIGGRQGLDITNIDITSALTPSQTSATVKFVTTDDTYLPNAIGTQIDINAPVFTITKSSTEDFVIPNDTVFPYSITINNTGSIPANNCLLKDTLPQGLNFVPNSLTVDSKASTENIEDGVKLGTIAPGTTIKITFNVTATDFPYDKSSYSNSARLTYNFQSTIGFIQGLTQSNSLSTETSAFLLPPLLPNVQAITYKNTPVTGKLRAISSTTTISSYKLASNPTNGFSNVNLDGSWLYTPKVGFTGTDTFSTSVTDSNGDSSICTITIIVKDVFKYQNPINLKVNKIIFPKVGVESCHYI
ncbi:Ig-like domain-containing protein [Clostridium niameyense]|uniref:Ig-like domain-containing protein n=1 Tax=Clostridium niameyense TaxID=1622073 RepID=UPI00067E841D|nr:Ig-like domain-containing protein [Clostridium niameyense]